MARPSPEHFGGDRKGLTKFCLKILGFGSIKDFALKTFGQFAF